MTEFIRQLRTRRLLSQTLLDFAGRQRQLASVGDDEALADLLRRKDRVLSRLRDIGGAAEWRAARDTLDPQTRTECETLIEACRRDLQQVYEQDLAVATEVTARRDATQQTLRQLRDSQPATQAYDSPPTPRLNLRT